MLESYFAFGVGIPSPNEVESCFVRKLVKYSMWAYVLCFGNIFQIDFPRKVWELLPKVPKTLYTSKENHVRLKTVFPPNLCSSLWFPIGLQWEFHGIPIKSHQNH